MLEDAQATHDLQGTPGLTPLPAVPTAARTNGHPRGDRRRDLGLPPDSASTVLSSELESSSFIDSDEDDNTSRCVCVGVSKWVCGYASGCAGMCVQVCVCASGHVGVGCKLACGRGCVQVGMWVQLGMWACVQAVMWAWVCGCPGCACVNRCACTQGGASVHMCIGVYWCMHRCVHVQVWQVCAHEGVHAQVCVHVVWCAQVHVCLSVCMLCTRVCASAASHVTYPVFVSVFA